MDFKFEDGLSEAKVRNNVNYNWLFADDVKVKDAIIGLDNGNIVFKSGTWISGTFGKSIKK